MEESKVISLVVILQFETSGKWPDDLTAIQHIKAVFHIRLAELLKSECSLITAASRQHVDVLKVGCCKRMDMSFNAFLYHLASELISLSILFKLQLR